MALVQGSIPGRQTRSLVAGLGAPLSLLLAIGLTVAAMLLPVVQSSDATTTGYSIQKRTQEAKQLLAQVGRTPFPSFPRRRGKATMRIRHMRDRDEYFCE